MWANSIGLELLREGPLLLNVLPFAGPKCLVHVLGAANVDDSELAKIDACLVAGIFEHCEGLASSEEDHLRPLQWGRDLGGEAGGYREAEVPPAAVVRNDDGPSQ
jgi:hypothetical protein